MLLGYERTYLPDPHPQWEPVYNERRFNHTVVLGKTGMGKSTFLVNSAIEDVLSGDGIAFFDPHGDAIDSIIKHVPPERVILVDPSDVDYPVGFNPLHNVEDFPFVASAMLDTFKSIWGSSWGPQLEQYLYNGIAALAEVPDGTLIGLKYLLTSRLYRKRVMSFVSDPIIRDFWSSDFEEIMPDKEKRQTTLSTLNKIGALISDPKLRNVLGQPKSTVNLRSAMDTRKCLLIRLPQGKLGIQKTAMLGSLLMAQIHLAALSREARSPLHVYADEAHHFGTSTLEEMLSGVRKFGVSLVLAHQYLDQLSPSLRAALLGTVGSIVSFRLGVGDAELLAKEMETKTCKITPRDLLTLPPYTVRAKCNDGGRLLTTQEIEHPEWPDGPRLAIELTRSRYGRKRLRVENKINKFIRST